MSRWPPPLAANEAAPPSPIDDSFELWDLRVEVVCPPGQRVMCGAQPGDHFELQGEMLHLPPGQGFSIYSLAALLPLLPAKQRVTHANDWMSTDAEVACPDPNCPTRLRITRLGKRRFQHGMTTVVPLPAALPAALPTALPPTGSGQTLATGAASTSSSS